MGNQDIPDPDHLIRECWTADEFTLGAYSYPKVGANLKVFKQMGDWSYFFDIRWIVFL